MARACRTTKAAWSASPRSHHYATAGTGSKGHAKLPLPPSGVQHFDLAFDAFEQLAHPVYGVVMLKYRPVDCDTKVRLEGKTANLGC